MNDQPSEKKKERKVQVRITWNGHTHSVKTWSEITGLPISALYSRKKKNWPPDKILTLPLGARYIDASHICEGCEHWRRLGASNLMYCCHYLLDTGESRCFHQGKREERCERVREYQKQEDIVKQAYQKYFSN